MISASEISMTAINFHFQGLFSVRAAIRLGRVTIVKLGLTKTIINVSCIFAPVLIQTTILSRAA